MKRSEVLRRYNELEQALKELCPVRPAMAEALDIVQMARQKEFGFEIAWGWTQYEIAKKEEEIEDEKTN